MGGERDSRFSLSMQYRLCGLDDFVFLPVIAGIDPKALCLSTRYAVCDTCERFGFWCDIQSVLLRLLKNQDAIFSMIAKLIVWPIRVTSRHPASHRRRTKKIISGIAPSNDRYKLATYFKVVDG
jgi:hypothetical protein